MSFFSLIKLCRIVEEMRENIINSRTISTKLNRIFSELVMYQGIMTFVLMTKEAEMGLCFLQTEKAHPSLCAVATPAAQTVPGRTHVPQVHVRVFLTIQPLLMRFCLKHMRFQREWTSWCCSSGGHSAVATASARRKLKVQSKGLTPWRGGLIL